MGSRIVMNTVLSPGRRLTCAIWPSTHTAPSRLIQPSIRVAIWRTGAGDWAVVSRGMGGSLGDRRRAAHAFGAAEASVDSAP